MLVGEREEPRARWEVSPPQEVVAGSQAVMQGREVQRGVVSGNWGGFQQCGPHCRCFAPLLLYGCGAWSIFRFGFDRLQRLGSCRRRRVLLFGHCRVASFLFYLVALRLDDLRLHFGFQLLALLLLRLVSLAL